jgi:hypothetical protein
MKDDVEADEHVPRWGPWCRTWGCGAVVLLRAKAQLTRLLQLTGRESARRCARSTPVRRGPIARNECTYLLSARFLSHQGDECFSAHSASLS